MDRISALVEGGLKPISFLCQTIEKKILGIGKLIDHYMDKQTQRNKYICELLLDIPFIFILQQQCQLNPYSNYTIVNCVLIILWAIGGICLVCAFHLNIPTRLRLYLMLSIDITMAWITLFNYCRYQQESYEVCDEVNVLQWIGITHTLRQPGTLTILIRGLYIGVRFKDIVDIQNLRLALSATLIPDILCVIGFFPVFMSELSYWLHGTVFMAVFITETLQAQVLHMDITNAKINELREMAKKEEKDALRKNYIAGADALAEHLKSREIVTVDFVRNCLPGQWFVRDCLFVCAVLYCSTALVAQLILSQHSVYELLNIDFVLSVIEKWCTSVVTLALFAAFLTSITNICIGCSFVFLTTGRHIAKVMNSNTAKIVYMTIVLLFSESNMLSLACIDKINAMKIVTFFSILVFLYHNLSVIERNVLYVQNVGVPHKASFFLRFGIIMGLFVTVPTLTTCYVSQNLQTEFLPLLFAVGNHLVIVVALFLVVECLLVSIKWRTIQYGSKHEITIHYFDTLKNLLVLVICILFQSYFKILRPNFKAWWFYRLILTCSVGGVGIGILSISEWRKYKQLELINSLPDVRYVRYEDEVHECSICSSELYNGKALPCSHSFHIDCLQLWFRFRQVCPVCKTHIDKMISRKQTHTRKPSQHTNFTRTNEHKNHSTHGNIKKTGRQNIVSPRDTALELSVARIQ